MPRFNLPHEKQLEWLHSKKEARIRLALAGVQGGKTEIGCRRIAGDLKNNKNEFFMVVAPTYKILTQATMVKLEEVLNIMNGGPGWIVRRNERDRMFWRDRNGNIIYLRSAENPDYLRGPTLKSVLFDECAIVGSPQPFRILRQRVNVKRGNIYLTTTPQGANWILREIIKPWQSGDPMYHVVNWPSYLNPAFDYAEYERAKKYEDPRWVEQEYEGKITELGGLVFPEFDEDLHVGPLEYIPELPIYWSVDFGWRNPNVVLFWQILPDLGPNGKLHCLAELVLRRHTIEEVVLHAINSKEPVNYAQYRWPEYACCDPAGRAKQQTSGISLIEAMQDLGIPVIEPEEDWNADDIRFLAIRDMHRFLRSEMILFDRDKCWNMINAFGLYSTPPQKEGEPAIEKPIKDGRSDHMMEASFYFLLGKPYYDNETHEPDINKRIEQILLQKGLAGFPFNSEGYIEHDWWDIFSSRDDSGIILN